MYMIGIISYVSNFIKARLRNNFKLIGYTYSNYRKERTEVREIKSD